MLTVHLFPILRERSQCYPLISPRNQERWGHPGRGSVISEWREWDADPLAPLDWLIHAIALTTMAAILAFEIL